MQEALHEKRWIRLYGWTVEAKSIMALYFVASVFLYLFFGMIHGLNTGGEWLSLDIGTATQMLFASLLVGLLKQCLFPGHVFSLVRCLLWVFAGTLDVAIFALGFGWFSSFPIGYLILFICIMSLGMGMMLFTYFLNARCETRRLNLQLEKYQRQEGHLQSTDHE